MCEKTKVFLMIAGGFLIVVTSIGVLSSLSSGRITSRLENGYCQEKTGCGSPIWTRCKTGGQ